jgi:RNA polymerase sigma-70 factor (ECF subfamily)
MDPTIIESARRGEGDAFAMIVREKASELFAVAYRVLRDTELAEDAVQQAFANAWRELPRLRDVGRFDAWMYRLLLNASFREARDRRRHQARIRMLSPIEERADDEAVSIANRDQLERAFRRLTPEHRAIVVLHHYAGMPLAEIASVLVIAPGTARSRLHYATRVLRAALEADAREPGGPVTLITDVAK